MNAVCILGIFALILSGMAVQSFAHKTVSVDKYDIEAGWGVEPPIVGLRNSVVISVLERGEIEGQFSGVSHALRAIDVEIFSGGESKILAFNADPRPGHYYSQIIPTKTGTYLVELKGDLRGTPIDIKIPIEDVEYTAALDFPPVRGGGDSTSGASGAEIAALKKAIISLQQDLSKIQSGETAIVPGDGGNDGGGDAYNFAIMGLSISVAAVVLGVVALTRKLVV